MGTLWDPFRAALLGEYAFLRVPCKVDEAGDGTGKSRMVDDMVQTECKPCFVLLSSVRMFTLHQVGIDDTSPTIQRCFFEKVEGEQFVRLLTKAC